MKRLYQIASLIILLSLAGISVQAQTSIFEIFYGETSSGFFDEQTNPRWFLLDAQEGDIPIIQVQRISGQFTPRIRLLDGEGNLISEGQGTAFPDTDELILDTGLPSAPIPYQVEIIAENIIADVSANPLEYSITVERDGTLLRPSDDTFSVLPDVGTDAPPNLEIGDNQPLSIQIDAYGQQATVTNNPTPNIPERVLITTDSWEIQVNQLTPITQAVRSMTFLESGVGVSVRNTSNSTFFSDENFLIAFNDVTREYRFTLDSGTVIVSDFVNVASIEVEDGIVAYRMQIGDTIKRLVFDSDLVDLRRLTAGENEASLYQLLLPNSDIIITDLLGWDTLEYVTGQVRVIYGRNSQFITDTVNLSLRQSTTTDQQNIVVTTTVADELNPRRLNINTNWLRINQISLLANTLTVESRNGITYTESADNLATVQTNDGATLFERRDGTVRSVFPDGTDINTPAQLAENSDILPYAPGFRTRNYNNLGADILPLCTCVGDLQGDTPVNPTNGNFFYSVTDFSIFGQTLPLELTRYYNSHDSGVTPRYLINSPEGYLRFGTGWRHSYQYELDIAGAPNGRIRFVEPDGTSHYFFPQANGTQWTSRTLLSLRITRTGGILGEWQAQRTDGLTYYFDRVGRLTRISESSELSIMFSPMPLAYDDLGETGMFVIGPYGRRLELYANADGRIQTARDTIANRISYSYDSQRLIGVEYGSPTQTAVYTYDGRNLLTRYDDVRSPYLKVGAIEYDARQRVGRYIQNPDGNLIQDYIFIYEETESERITQRVFVVDDPQRSLTLEQRRRVQTWTYNELWQLTNISLPADDWDYAFTYNQATGTLSSVRTPQQVRFNLVFDDFGNLIRFEDPLFTGDNAYLFTYQQQGNISLLTQIRYPNNRVTNFTWSDDATPRLIAEEILVSTGLETVTRRTTYEYDNFGRLSLLVNPANIGTLYQYDDVGYVSEIWRGITVAEGETSSDITDRNRALNVVELSHNIIGQLRAIVDGRNTHRYTLNWNRAGQVTEISHAQGSSIQYSYDDRGRVIGVNDRGQQIAYTYNGLDLVASMTDIGGSLLTYDYDEAGNLLRIVDDLQRETTFAYDVLDNLIRTQSPTGLTYQYDTSLDPNGDFIIHTETDPMGRVIERRYNPLGRLTLYSLTDGEFSQEFALFYTSGGNLTTIRETAQGRELTLSYNLAGDVTAITVEGSTTSFAYTPNALLASVTSPEGRVTAYDYDGLDNITGVTLPDGNRWQYTYDENSNLITATDPLNLATTYAYNSLNQLISEENADGNIQSYQYDTRGNLVSITDPNGISTDFQYNAFNDVTSINSARLETTYIYDSIARLVEVGLSNSSEITLTYDDEDNIIALNEGQQTLSYDALGRITSITDPLGHTTSYDYNSVGLVTAITDAVGNVDQYQWRDATGFLQSYTSSANRTYTTNTDDLGRVTLMRLTNIPNPPDNFDPLGAQYVYDADGYIESIQLGTNNARESGINDQFYRYQYNANGDVIQYTDPTDGVWQFDYDNARRLVRVTNPNGVPTTYVYDGADNITAVIRYQGTEAETIETFIYDENGNVVRYQSPLGVVNTYTYNGNNQLTVATLAAESEMPVQYIFEYDGEQLELVIDPNGQQTRYLYSSDNLTRIERQFGDDILSISYRYDDVGNLISVTLPGPDEDINLTYDSLDRRVRYVNGADNSWAYTYDAADNISQVSDPSGSVVSYLYDEYDRITEIEFPSGSIVDLAYDSGGNLRSVTLPRNSANSTQILTYVLNEVGQVEEMRVGNNVTAFEYDALGNVIRRIMPTNATTDYTYDDAGRLQTVTYSDETSIAYTYDAIGQLTSVADLNFTYDDLGRVVSAQSNVQIDYAYDAIGNLLERNAGSLGATSYIYDELYRVQQINFANEQINLTYNENSQISSVERSNGASTTILYDDAGRPTIINHFDSNGSRIETFNYSYDAIGNPISVSGLNTPRVSYSYDIDQRLISERWLNATGETVYVVSYRYDSAGNRIEETRNGVRTTFTYNAQNQLIRTTENRSDRANASLIIPSIGLGALVLFLRRRRRLWAIVPIAGFGFVGVALAQTADQITYEYTYDANGNVSSISAITDETFTLDLTYDNENRLSAVIGQDEEGDEVNTVIAYDALSRMTTLTTTDDEYTFFYDDHTLIGMRNNAGETERYLNLNGERLLTILADGEALWHLNDRQGSTRRFADSTGLELDTSQRFLEFSSFGLRIFPYTDNADEINSARFDAPTSLYNSELYDPSTNLYFIGLRAYDPRTGRFLQADPVRQDPIGTLYTYARNRPLVYNDPTGMFVDTFVQPLAVDTMVNQVNPENLIPEPYVPEISLPPSVHQQQAEETFRAFELLEATTFGVNEAVLRLSPLNDTLHLYTLSPVPDVTQTQVTSSLHQIMDIFNSNNSWQPDLAPSPATNPNPFAIVSEIEPLLGHAYIAPLTFCCDTPTLSDMQVLPSVYEPQMLPDDTRITRAMTQQLQPISMLNALSIETNSLIAMPPDITPMIEMPDVSLPTVAIEPPTMQSLDALREETFQFYNRIWSVDTDCVDCVPALRFNP